MPIEIVEGDLLDQRVDVLVNAWTATERSIRDSTRNAIALANRLGCRSIALPIIGAGSGSFSPARAQQLMLDALRECAGDLRVTLVRFHP